MTQLLNNKIVDIVEEIVEKKSRKTILSNPKIFTIFKVKNETRGSRSKETAEVFSPDSLVEEMVDKLPPIFWKKDKTFIDPAVGNGQFLSSILDKKIRAYKHLSKEALKTLYGIDIQADNVKECRFRLLEIISHYETITIEHVKIVMKNIVWVNPKKFPNGSLDYDFEFNNSIKDKDAKNWLKYFEGKTKQEPLVEGEIAENDMSDLF